MIAGKGTSRGRVAGAATQTGERHHDAARAPGRPMVRASLLGSHEHQTADGQRVQVVRRGGKFMARLRRDGQQLGVTLGADERAAGRELSRLLVELEDGTFVPSADARRRSLRKARIPRATLRDLLDAYVAECRKLRGALTAQAYRNRLMHTLDFAELPANLKRWPLARDMNRVFAVELRAFLMNRDVARNGRPASPQRSKMSLTQVRLCLEALRAAFNWAVRADVRMLPIDFAQPISPDILGPKSGKDPLRSCPLPLPKRMALVGAMDAWQLLNLTVLLVLPIRFEDLSGAMISDFDLEAGTWTLGTRLGGNDFNKGRVTVRMPLAPELIAVLRRCAGDRTDGPMFQARPTRKGRAARRPGFSNPDEFRILCEQRLAAAPRAEVETEQDRKIVVRKLLLDCGGLSTDTVGKEVGKLFAVVDVPPGTRPYDLRAAVTTDMSQAGVRHLEQTYLTLHKTDDILNEYTPLDPQAEMAKHYRHVAPLLQAIQARLGDGLR